MTDHKFTGEEVIKALDICAHDKPCGDCPIKCNDCNVVLADCTIALISRQKAEIERLQVELDDLKRDTIPKLQWSLQRANDMGRDLEVELEAMRCAANSYLKRFLKRKTQQDITRRARKW